MGSEKVYHLMTADRCYRELVGGPVTVVLGLFWCELALSPKPKGYDVSEVRCILDEVHVRGEGGEIQVVFWRIRYYYGMKSGERGELG